MKTLRPLFLIVAFVLLVSMACTFGASAGTDAPEPQPPVQQDPPTKEPEQAPTDVPTDVPAPTDAPTDVPTDEPTPFAPDFFTEEFNTDADLSNWSYFEFHGNDGDAEPKLDNGYLAFDLQKSNLWVYVTYDSYTYDNVRLELTADNRGKNNNNVSLICRYSDEGWYEFNIANNGLYWIYAYLTSEKDYFRIYNGGSTAIKQGKDTNVYTAICDGDSLSLYINGVEARTVKDTKYKLRDGQVGFGVSSFDVTPILVEVDSFDISVP